MPHAYARYDGNGQFTVMTSGRGASSTVNVVRVVPVYYDKVTIVGEAPTATGFFLPLDHAVSESDLPENCRERVCRLISEVVRADVP